MAKLRFIEVPHPKKGNGLRYKDVLVKFVNDMRTELHELDSLGRAFGLAPFHFRHLRELASKTVLAFSGTISYTVYVAGRPAR